MSTLTNLRRAVATLVAAVVTAASLFVAAQPARADLSHLSSYLLRFYAPSCEELVEDFWATQDYAKIIEPQLTAARQAWADERATNGVPDGEDWALYWEAAAILDQVAQVQEDLMWAEIARFVFTRRYTHANGVTPWGTKVGPVEPNQPPIEFGPDGEVIFPGAPLEVVPEADEGKPWGAEYNQADRIVRELKTQLRNLQTVWDAFPEAVRNLVTLEAQYQAITDRLRDLSREIEARGCRL